MGKTQKPIRPPVIIACNHDNLLQEFYDAIAQLPRFIGKHWVRVINLIKLEDGIFYYRVSYRKRTPEEY